MNRVLKSEQSCLQDDALTGKMDRYCNLYLKMAAFNDDHKIRYMDKHCRRYNRDKRERCPSEHYWRNS